MKKIVIVFLSMIVFVGCKKHEAKKDVLEESKIVVEEKLMSLLQVGCFVFTDGESKILMEIEDIGDQVKGYLNYALAEKDSNEGTFVGELIDDKLIGVYTFSSEGVISSREVAFLVKGDQLIEGFGELNESGNGFKDETTINYMSTMPLTKTECDK